MAETSFEITPGRLAETRGETTLPSQVSVLVEVRFAQLDIEVPGEHLRAEGVLGHADGGEQVRWIEGREACPFERDRSLDDPLHVPGKAMHPGGAVHDPDDVISGAGPRGGGHVFDNGSHGARVQSQSN